MKTKEEIFEENFGDLNEYSDFGKKTILGAMNSFANQQSEAMAVEFAEWIRDNYTPQPHMESNHAYVSNIDVEANLPLYWRYYDTEQLYSLFQNDKGK